MLPLEGPLLLVGAGKMGGALLSGLLDRGLPPGNILVQDPGPPDDIAAMLSRQGIEAHANIAADAPTPSIILMAVKPQAMDAVFPGVAKRAGPKTLIVSIAAGKPIASFEQHLSASAPVIRAMPNTPAAIGRGITVCCANTHVTPPQRDACEQMLSAVGEVGWVEDEDLMDAVTAVSGSGPAYVFLLAECLTAAGIKAGLDANLASRLACATVSGSGELLHLSGEAAATLRKNVTSPGGTTAAALEVLMREPDGLQALMEEAVLAAAKRGRELAG